MRICIPIQHDEGLKSPVYDHFGSAPLFLIYDTETQTHEIFANAGAEHAHGMCNPLRALENRKIEAVVCRGMGLRAIMKLQEGQVRAFRTEDETVEQVIASFRNATLEEMTVEHACRNHHCHE
jgi:predicted Fe-Mo cluster-binding NifX family protein